MGHYREVHSATLIRFEGCYGDTLDDPDRVGRGSGCQTTHARQRPWWLYCYCPDWNRGSSNWHVYGSSIALVRRRRTSRVCRFGHRSDAPFTALAAVRPTSTPRLTYVPDLTERCAESCLLFRVGTALGARHMMPRVAKHHP